MANVKITELQETESLEGFYTIGSKNIEGTEVSCKYNLGNLEGSEKALSAIEGQNNIPEFSPLSNYYPGTYVLYGNYVWRFTETHVAGPWTETDVVQTSAFNELKDLTGEDYEVIYFTLASEDQGLNVSGRNVTITFADGSTTQYIQTNAEGRCQFSILKGRTYTASVASQSGYITPDPWTCKAKLNARYVNFVYRKTAPTQTSTITFQFSLAGEGGTSSAIVGKTVNLFSGTSTTAFQTATVDSDGKAVFSNVTMGTTCTTGFAMVDNYAMPPNITFLVSDTVMGFDASYRYIGTARGIYLVADTGEEYELSAGAYPTTDVTYVALHVKTEELASRGFDYFIRLVDLTSSRIASTKKAWSTNLANAWKKLPNVKVYSASAPFYDGPQMTYYMARDSRELTPAESSPAAEYATQQTLTFLGKTYTGYIGTREQWKPLVDATNKATIYNLLPELGFTPNYYTQSIWTSSQYSAANYSWSWNGGSWSSYGTKSSSSFVLPFFAVH